MSREDELPTSVKIARNPMTRCKRCPAVISLVELAGGKWHPIDLPPVFGHLRGDELKDRLVVPRLRQVVACTIITPEEAAELPISQLVLGSVSHFATCPKAEEFRNG